MYPLLSNESIREELDPVQDAAAAAAATPLGDADASCSGVQC